LRRTGRPDGTIWYGTVRYRTVPYGTASVSNVLTADSTTNIKGADIQALVECRKVRTVPYGTIP